VPTTQILTRARLTQSSSLSTVLYCILFCRFGMGFHDPSLCQESRHHYQGMLILLSCRLKTSPFRLEQTYFQLKQSSCQLKQPPTLFDRLTHPCCCCFILFVVASLGSHGLRYSTRRLPGISLGNGCLLMGRDQYMVPHSTSRHLQAKTRIAGRCQQCRGNGLLYIMDCHSVFYLSISAVPVFRIVY
jgi:hypothetical protein